MGVGMGMGMGVGVGVGVGMCGVGQYEPFILELDEAKRYVWCQCGVSMKQPFCDGNSHR